MSFRTLAAATALAAGALGSTVLAAAQPASADIGGGVHANNIHTVCAETLSLFDTPGGTKIATLHQGEEFDFIRSNGNGYDYGYAITPGRNGWVQAGWFC